MNILQLVHTPVEFEPATFALGRILASRNHNVWCLGYSRQGLPAQEQMCPGYQLLRVPRGDWSYLPRLLRAATRFGAYCAGVVSRCRSFKADLIIAYGYDVLPLAVHLAPNDRSVVYYCTEFSDLPTAKHFLIGWGFAKSVEPYFVRRVGRVISVEENRARLQARQWGRTSDEIILNAPLHDGELETRSQEAILARRPGLRLVYAGSISHRNCLDVLVRAVAAVPEATLDIYGRVNLEYKQQFLEAIQAAPSRIRYMDTIEYARLPAILLKYDAGVCFYDTTSTNTLYASPAKLLEYLRSGLLAVTTSQKLPAHIVQQSSCGYVVASTEPAELSALFLHLVRNQDEVIQRRLNALSEFRRLYCYQVQSAALVDWIEEQLAPTGRGAHQR